MMREEEKLCSIYGGLRCPECKILLISKYAADCRKKYEMKDHLVIPSIPKQYFVEIKLKPHQTLDVNRTRDLNFLDGEFLGLHLIRNHYCMSCDTDDSQFIFAIPCNNV